MKPTSSINAQRGTGWVVVQFALMFAILAAGPVWRAQWPGGWTGALGGALLAVGAWAGLRGDRALGAQRTPFVKPKDAGQLVTTGIYARVRHPLLPQRHRARICVGAALAQLAGACAGGGASAVLRRESTP